MATINYSLQRLDNDEGERAHIQRAIASLRDEFEIRDKKILELGSGTGYNLSLFLPDNKVLGVEGLADAAEAANKLGVSTIVANLEHPLPLSDGDYDWVLCMDVLEHLVAPEIALKEAYRMLKQDGKLLINVPNHFTLMGRLRILGGGGIHWNNFFPNSQDWNNPHVRFFTLASIYGLLSSCGFRVVRDCSSVSTAVPMSQELRHMGMGWFVERLARKSTSLFCGGFLLLAERES